MINIGNVCLYISLLSAVVAVCAVVYSNSTIAKRAIFFQFCLLSIAFLKLVNSHINTDLSFSNVLNNSHHMIPMLYKITGVWANHEGSMLFLVWIFSLVTIIFIHNKDVPITAVCTQSLILSLLLAFLIFACNPFLKSTTLFPAGLGFNPLLQDVALSIHPPILYSGYAGLSVPFSMMVGSRGKKINIKALHRWIIYPWALLTLGIGLGGWWAYRELGWGGFWFWDPVENVSLVVWLFATASLHSVNISERAGLVNKSTVITSVCTFLAVILGVFLVRSGILNSVHSFAFDARRGIFLFGIFLFLCLISIYSLRLLPKVKVKGSLPMTLGLWYMTILAAIIILGVVYPFLHELVYKKTISVDEQFYERTLSIVFIPLLITLIIYSCPRIIILIPSIALFILLNLYYPVPSLLHKAYVFLGIAAVVSTLSQSIFKKQMSLSMIFGHLGLSILVLGGGLYYSFKTDQNFAMQKNQKIYVAGYEITLRGVTYSKQDNYLFRQADLEIEKNGKMLGVIRPQIRFYPIEKSYTYESGMLHTFSGDIYTTIGAINESGDLSLNVQYKPFIYLIWFSLVLMSIGGVLGRFSYRRTT